MSPAGLRCNSENEKFSSPIVWCAQSLTSGHSATLNKQLLLRMRVILSLPVTELGFCGMNRMLLKHSSPTIFLGFVDGRFCLFHLALREGLVCTVAAGRPQIVSKSLC